jgi:16S rRNA G966 N2-methylase RsmD
MRPFFTYFGGKYRLAPRYPATQYDLVIEPFAGSAGFSVHRPAPRVMLVDLDERVIGTWQYLIRTPAEEIMRLPLYDGTWETTDDLDLPQEARWLIGWWLGKGNIAPCKRPSAWVSKIPPENTGENVWGVGVRARLARQVGLIRHWEAIHGSYLDIPNTEATWFIDPPYEVMGRYRVRDINFPQLAAWCQDRLGQVIVCENEGATWLPFEPFHTAQGTYGTCRTGISRESVWLGGVQ